MARILFWLMMSATLGNLASGAERLTQTLIHADRRINLETWHLTSEDLKMRGPEWKIHKYRLRGGRQEGVDVIILDNGKLIFTLVPTRGMSIHKVESPATSLKWDSPVKELVHPHFMNLESRGGLGWLEGFNEWMVRCGLEFAGHPGKDKFINNTGDEAEMDLTLHGKIGNIPASVVEVIVDRAPPHRLIVRGRVDERMFYGPKLELWTELSTEPGSSQFRIQDTVSNQSAYDQEFELIYHCNFGLPLLDEGAEFAGAAQRVVPFNARAAEDVKRFQVYAGPTKGFVEQVYKIYPLADSNHRTTIALRNAAGTRGVAMAYSIKELPYLTLWKNTTALEEGYVTGLEPGTSFPHNRRVERAKGRVPKLRAGETRSFTVEYSVLTTSEEVRSVLDGIRNLQGSHPVDIQSEPEAIE